MLPSFMTEKFPFGRQLKREIKKHTFNALCGVCIHPKNNQSLANTSSMCN